MIPMPTLNKLHKITLNDKLLVGPNFDRIRQRVMNEMGIDILDMPDGNVWETKRGLWPKRFKTWLYKTFDYREDNIDPKLLSDIGGIMGKMTVNHTFYVDFVNEARWKAGAFGEKCSSCWWSTSYGRARLGLFEHGGIAMRFFSSPRQRSINKGQKGIGRAWIFPTGNDLFLFNSYGFEMAISARVLAAILGDGWRYDTVQFYISDAYINHDHAVRFSTSGFDPRERISLPSIQSDYVGYCHHCGEAVDAYNNHTYQDRDESLRIYHKKCIKHDMGNCTYCAEFRPHDDLVSLPHYNNDLVCHSCLDSYYPKCEDCGRYTKQRDINAVYWKRTELAVCNDCLPKYPRCDCGNYFKNRTTLRKHQGNCRTYKRRHPTAAPTQRLTIAEIRRAWEDSNVSPSAYQELVGRYAEQEGINYTRVYSDVLAYRLNPAPSITLEEVHRAEVDAEVDDTVSYEQYSNLVERYAEQEHISRTEAVIRAHNYQAQDPSQTPARPEPTLQTWWNLSDPLAQQYDASQGQEAQGIPTPTNMASISGADIAAPTILDGSQPVESPSQGQERGAFGWSPMDRLRGAIQTRPDWRRYYYEWQQQPERTTEPLAGIDSGLSEQEMQGLREAVYRIEDNRFSGSWIALFDAAGDADQSGVHGHDTEQNHPTETE